MIEFGYNNSYQSSIQIDPFDSLYDSMCRSHIGWFEVVEVTFIGTKLIHAAMKKGQLIRERLKMPQSQLEFYANVRRKNLEFEG